MVEPNPSKPYGHADASFQAMGGEPGVRRLVDAFYDRMQTLPKAREVLEMHPEDLAVSRDKLAAFLCGWLGGPKRYSERYGSIRIPAAHAHLPITSEHAEAWLACMRFAIDHIDVADDFREYFMRQIRVPSERIVRACQRAEP